MVTDREKISSAKFLDLTNIKTFLVQNFLYLLSITHKKKWTKKKATLIHVTKTRSLDSENLLQPLAVKFKWPKNVGQVNIGYIIRSLIQLQKCNIKNEYRFANIIPTDFVIYYFLSLLLLYLKTIFYAKKNFAGLTHLMNFWNLSTNATFIE